MALAGGRGCQAAISSPLPLSILASLDRPTEPGAADASGTTAGACSQTDPHLAPVEIAQAETHSPATPAATAGLSASARARAAAARIRAEAPRKPASSTGPAASPANPAIAVNIKGTVTGTSSVPLVGIEVDVMSASFGYVTYTTSGTGGAYSVPVDPGFYYLAFYDYAGNYLSGYYSTSGFTRDSGLATLVTISGSDLTGINVKMAAARHIAGTVTKAGGSTPIAGLSVEARTVDDSWVDSVSTAADGKYALNLEAGKYLVYIRDYTGTYASGYYSTSGFTYLAGEASVVSITAADAAGINIALPTSLHISGKVTKSGGTGLADIDVSALNSGAGDDGWVMTAADGTFAVAVAPGTYRLYFAPDSGIAYASGYYSTAGFTYSYAAASPITVGSANVTGKNVTLPAAILMKGKVTRTGGVGLPNIDVYPDNSETYTESATTAADGTYAAVVAPGVYTLYFRDSSGTYGSGYMSATGFTYDSTSAVKITVGSAGVTGKNITLPAAVHIKGKVTRSGGVGLLGITVNARSSNGAFQASTATAADGTYSLAVAPATYTVAFVDGSSTYGSGYYSSTGFTYYQAHATPVTVGSSDVTGKNAVLPIAIHITGKVTRNGGVGLGGVSVDATAAGSTGSSETAPDGTYSVAVAPGVYGLSFGAPSDLYASGYWSSAGFTYSRTASTPVTVAAADVSGKNLTLPPAVHIKGKVMKSGGVGLPNIEVDAHGLDVEDSGYAYTSASGDFSVAVNPGTYILSFYDGTGLKYLGGYYSTSGITGSSDNASPITVSSADVGGKNTTLKTALHIKGKVTGSGGASLSRIWVYAEGPNGTAGYGVTAADGTYSVTLGPGAYTLYFEDDSGKYGNGFYSAAGFTYSPTGASTVTVSTADLTGKNVKLPTAVHIKGKVTRNGTTGLANIRVTATGPAGTFNTYAYTGADGTYSIPVTPGVNTLSFFDYAHTYADGYYSSSGYTSSASSATKITVGSTDVTGKNINLPMRIHISGKVIRSGGAGIWGVEVDAIGPIGDYTYSAPDGTYTLAVSPGSYSLEIYDPWRTFADGYYSTSGFTYYENKLSTLTVPSSGLTGKNITIPLAVRVRGKVTKSSGTALQGIEVNASSSDGRFASWMKTGSDGSYSIEVPPGTYTLWFRDHSGVNGAGYYSTAGFKYDSASASGVAVSTADRTGLNVVMTAASSLVFPASTYTAIAPSRVLDTRPTGGGHTNIGLTGVFGAGTVRTFKVGGATYVGGYGDWAAPWNAVAVTGNVTIVNETAAGLVALGPTMAATGEVTTINFVKGDIRANNVTVGLAPGGTISAVYRSSTAGATTQLIFDVTGYFLPSTTGATYHAVAPGRVLDTRATTGSHTNIGLKGKFANRVVRTFGVAGVKALGWSSALVPSSATAVTGNLTVTAASSVGYVALGPTMTSTPSTSTINVAKGANCANGVTVALRGGKLQAVWAGTTGSSADVIFDVTGYFTDSLTGLRYHPITPVRLLDSSKGKGLAGAFHSKTSRTLVVGGIAAIPADAKGISGNLTVVGPSSAGYAFISPTTISSPTSSTVNASVHQTVANGFDVALSSGKLALIWVGTTGSTANLQLDVTGYWK